MLFCNKSYHSRCLFFFCSRRLEALSERSENNFIYIHVKLLCISSLFSAQANGFFYVSLTERWDSEEDEGGGKTSFDVFTCLPFQPREQGVQHVQTDAAIKWADRLTSPFSASGGVATCWPKLNIVVNVTSLSPQHSGAFHSHSDVPAAALSWEQLTARFCASDPLYLSLTYQHQSCTWLDLLVEFPKIWNQVLNWCTSSLSIDTSFSRAGAWRV